MLARLRTLYTALRDLAGTALEWVRQLPGLRAEPAVIVGVLVDVLRSAQDWLGGAVSPEDFAVTAITAVLRFLVYSPKSHERLSDLSYHVGRVIGEDSKT